MRTPGEGSLYLRADTGRYQAGVAVGYTPRGNVRRVYKSFDTKDEALAWIADQKKALHQGTRLDATATLRQVFDEWISNGEALKGWAPATKASYEDILGRFVLPKLGHVRVRDLTTSDVRKLLRDHAKAGVSMSMLRRVKRYLGTLMEDARLQRLIQHNPVPDVQLQAAPDPEIQRWSEDEVASVVRTCLDADGKTVDQQVAAYVLIALGTGLRTEELLGLTWADVDLEELVVTIRQVAPAGSKKALRAGGKTDNATRTVTIDDFTAAAFSRQRAYVDGLQAQRAHFNAKRAAEGLPPLPWADLDLVFCTSRGTVLDRGTLRRKFNELQDAAKVTRIRLYATRSTHGSILADAGVNLHALAERLGHADPRFTAKVYLKGSSSAHRAVAQQVGSILEAGARSSSVADGSGKRLGAAGSSGSQASSASSGNLTQTEPPGGSGS